MTIKAIEFGQAEDDQLTVTLSGEAAQIAKVLIEGLPRETLAQLDAALQDELKARAKKPAEPVRSEG